MDDKLYWYKAKCVRVIDGDTIEVVIDLGLKVGLHERIRLYGLNSSEIFGVKIGSESYIAGMKCKDRVVGLVEGKEIYINTIKDKQEKYGRYLGIVYFAENSQLVSLNKLLLDEGLAKVATY